MHHLGVADLQTVPVQASMDATAVTGRMASHKSKSDEDLRVVHALASHLPFQQHQIFINKKEGLDIIINSSNFCGMHWLENKSDGIVTYKKCFYTPYKANNIFNDHA